MISLIVLIAASYLAGSIPFAYLIARSRGVDIRLVGSGNVGATNVVRSVGRGWGALTFICDALKGMLPALLGPPAAAAWSGTPAHPAFGLICGAAAIFGHAWPVFLGFKGGKGVATGAGVVIGAAPLAAAAGLAVWLLVFVPFRYVSLASIAAVLAVPAAGWLVYAPEDLWRPAVLTGLAAMIVVRHRSNLRRLIAGTELRAGRCGGENESPNAAKGRKQN